MKILNLFRRKNHRKRRPFMVWLRSKFINKELRRT